MTVLTEAKRAQTNATVKSATGVLPIVAAATAGLFLIFFAGFAQATVFHDSAHDTRHTLAFPCH